MIDFLEKCIKVDNAGLEYLLNGLAKCKKLKWIKLYMKDTGITR